MARGDDLALEDIRRRIASRDAIAIVGAGASVSATRRNPVASWKGLLKHGLEHSAVFGLPRLSDDALAIATNLLDSPDVDVWLGVASIIERKLDAPAGAEWARWLRETVGTFRVEDSRLLDAILALGIPIATTNYDELLTVQSGSPPVTWKHAARWIQILKGEEKGIMHLHGYWNEPDTVVLGVRSYTELLQHDSTQSIQKAMGQFNTLLFIGFGSGLTDPNFRKLLGWLGSVGAASHRHYLLLLEEEAGQVRDSTTVYPVAYGSKHQHLVPFLAELIGDNHRSAGPSVRASRLMPGETFRDIPTGPEMVVVGPGKCMVGSIVRSRVAKGTAPLRPREAMIPHAIAVGRFPITWDEWMIFVQHDPNAHHPDDGGMGRGRKPVVDVNYFHVRDYLKWLSQETGCTYRLLRDEEWEYAARAGTTTNYWWGDEPSPDRGNYGNDQRGTTPVDEFEPNQFGIFDMLGNIWEWVEAAPSDASEDSSAARGGSWYYDPEAAQCSARLLIEKTRSFRGLGFRVARDIAQPPAIGARYRLTSLCSSFNIGPSPGENAILQVRPVTWWTLGEASDGYVVLRDDSGSALTVDDGSSEDYARIVLAPISQARWQHWSIEERPRGFLLRSRHSGKVLDVDGGRSVEGGAIIQFAEHGSDNQLWRFLSE